MLIATEIRAEQLGSLLDGTEIKNVNSDREHSIQTSYLVQERVKDLARQLTVVVIKLNGAMLLCIGYSGRRHDQCKYYSTKTAF